MVITAPMLGQFATLLVQKRTALLEARENGAESAKIVELDQSRVGRLSRMDAMQDQAMSIETNRRREIELRQIEAALGRISSGDYGKCLMCGEEITHARLAYSPEASLCLKCAEKADKGTR
jgi:DnaK suppressor protein